MNQYAQEYIDKGWTAPIPLPAGEKFPPPERTTGNIPSLKLTEIEKVWEGIPNGSNLGLRLQPFGDWDVIALDVDHYDGKIGDSYISEVEQELGSLGREEIPRSTRRGPTSPSAQYFFRVPKGVKWKSSACSDVEVVQMTHRYSAVYPSIVKETQYLWYQGKEKIEIPSVRELPVLPDRWVAFLKKSEIGKLSRTKRSNFKGTSGDRYRDSIEWLRSNISGWDTDENMSPSLKKVSDSEEFLASLEGNGHDSMVSAVHAAVMLGAEGHLGLKAALHKIKSNFVRSISLRPKGARSEKAATAEYESALIGQVDQLVSEVADGNIHLIEYGAELALPNFSQMLTRNESDRRPLDVDLGAYSDTDAGHAEMIKDYWDKDFMVVEGGDSSQEFAIWLSKTTRYHFQERRASFDRIEEAVSKRIEYEASKIQAVSEDLKTIGESRQYDTDELDPEELDAEVANLRKRANKVRQTSVRKSIMDALHGYPEIRINIEEFDSSPEIVGLPGGEVLDLHGLRTDGEDAIRRGRQIDLLTKSTAVRLVPGAESEAWDKFLDNFIPDLELRHFVQKVVGYSLVSGNPEKKLMFLYGPSNTGKTTFLESVARALGDYAGPMNAIKLFGANSGGPSPEMVESLNKRMVFMAEVGDDHQLSANSVKRVTGNDTQHTRQLHSNVMRSAAPKFTPYVSTNSVPDIRGVDAATRERIMVIPFEEVHPRTKITPENDLNNPKNLTAILWWVVEGLANYFEEGLDPEEWPDKVKEASGTFATNTGPFQAFLEDTLVRTEKRTDRIPLVDLFQRWESYCLVNRIDRREVGSMEDFRKSATGNNWVVERGTINKKKNQWFIRYVEIAS